MPRNLRILKKLSKRAAPLLTRLGDHREQFRAEPHENYTGLIIPDRKHFERFRSVHDQVCRQGETKWPARDGRGGFIGMYPPHHPTAGTVMVGATTGYYEPEWEEETAWEALETWVRHHFMEYPKDEDGVPTLTRRLDTPSHVFAAAAEMIAELSKPGATS